MTHSQGMDARIPRTTSVSWYVVLAKPRQERIAEANLLRQGYDAYLPWLKVLRKRLGQPHRLGFEPLFPRYLFFRPKGTGHSIGPVRSTIGVSALVAFGGTPAVLCPEALEVIRAFEAQQNCASTTELDALRPGERVVVTAGPLTGLEGLVAMVSRQRVTVLMQLLGEETRVRLDASELMLAA
jgi:transcriptional antiterminator RfaH